MRSSALVVLALVFANPIAAQDRRPMTTDDALDMVQVGSPLISPDGGWVLFSKSELDWEENERKTTWWRVPSDGSAEPYRFIGEDGGSSFQFSPDGAYLSFLRSANENGGGANGNDGNENNGAQLYLIRTDGGEAYQLSEHGTSVSSYAWGEDGSKIFFVANEEVDDEQEQARKDGYDAIFVDEGPNGQRMGEWRNLWSIEIDSREERRLTEGEQRVGAFSVTPDSERIVYSARSENRRNQGNLSEIYLLDVRSGATTQLTENAAPEGRLSWAPDGRRFVYEAPSDDTWELRLDKLWLMDPDSGDRRMISAAFAGNIRNFVWTPCA